MKFNSMREGDSPPFHGLKAVAIQYACSFPPSHTCPHFSRSHALTFSHMPTTLTILRSYVLTFLLSYAMTVSTHTTTDTRIKSSTRKKLKEETQEEKQVIVHCHYTCTNPYGMYIRIWPSTYLISKDVQHKSDLVHAENIPLAPDWMAVPPGARSQFTLIFTALPKDCQRFDLAEIIPQEGGFFVPNIERNELDVYEVEMRE